MIIRSFTILLLLISLFAQAVQASVVSVEGEKGGGSGKAQFTLNYPISFVRQVLNNDKLFIQLLPGVMLWQVMENSPKGQVAKCKMAMGKMVPPANYTVKVDKVSADEVRFKRLKGDLKNLEGYWKIEQGSDPSSTKVTYFYKVDTGMKMVPKPIIEKELRRHLVETEMKTSSQMKKLYSSVAHDSKPANVQLSGSSNSSRVD
ncbi:MAG: SRPBCC family protein [Candidatus Caenarcaniphilales bacterium]|nr:SRPBCC family protein [Candidatus Caenarcaniphilales bacterium]